MPSPRVWGRPLLLLPTHSNCLLPCLTPNILRPIPTFNPNHKQCRSHPKPTKPTANKLPPNQQSLPMPNPMTKKPNLSLSPNPILLPLLSQSRPNFKPDTAPPISSHKNRPKSPPPPPYVDPNTPILPHLRIYQILRTSRMPNRLEPRRLPYLTQPTPTLPIL